MLHFTGHALVDAGIAGMMAYANKKSPESLSEDDFERIADWLAGLYTTPGSLQNHIRGMLFFNAGYYAQNPSIRDNFVRRVLYSWKWHDESEEKCIFCESPAAYRANREELPLVNGRGVINFNPKGVEGTPICGLCSLATQMLPLVSVKAERLLMVMVSENQSITTAFATANFRRARQLFTLQEDTDVPSLPFLKTRFVESCLEWFIKSQRFQHQAAITAYCFTNYGAGAEIQILNLDASVFEWLDSIFHAYDVSSKIAWRKAIGLAWVNPKTETPENRQRNLLYEALIALPDRPHVVLEYLKRAGHWGLVESFLIRIMDMSPETVALLKQLGERFAVYAQEHRQFYYEFSRENQYAQWRRRLLRAADDSKRRYGQTLITFDEFLQAFTSPEKEYHEWRLSRDLIVLVMIEQLHIATDEVLFESDDNLVEED